MRFHNEVCSGSLRPRFFAHVATATEANTSRQIMRAFSVGVVLTAIALAAIAGVRPALTTGFSPGCSVMNSATGGLTL